MTEVHWLIATVLVPAAILGMGLYFRKTLEELLPSPAVWVCGLRDWVLGFAHRIQRMGKRQHFVILIARLAGDGPDQRHTRMITGSFLGRKDVDICPTCRVMRLPVGQREEAIANKRAKRWLRRHAADLLIWGEVVKQDGSLRLWMTAETGDTDFASPQFTIEANKLGDSFHEAVRLQICSLALAALHPIIASDELILAAALSDIVARLSHALENESDYSPEQNATLRDCLGVARFTISTLTGDRGPLESAIDDFRRALSLFERDDGATRSTINVHLGNAYRRLAGVYLRTDCNELAAGAFAAARADLRPSSPLKVRANVALGQAMLAGGAASDAEDVARLTASIEDLATEVGQEVEATSPNLWLAVETLKCELGRRRAYMLRASNEFIVIEATLRNLLQKAQRYSRAWADIKFCLSHVMTSRDELWPDIELVHGAIQELSEIKLNIVARDRPVLWAALQNNLCSLHSNLAEREKEVSELEDAIAGATDALHICPMERVPNLAVALAAALANAAVRRDDLKVGPGAMRVQRAPSFSTFAPGNNRDWSGQLTEVSRIIDLQTEVQSSADLLAAALDKLLHAISLVPPEYSRPAQARLQMVLGALLLRLAERSDKEEYFDQAIAAHKMALDFISRDKDPSAWARAMHGLGASYLGRGDALTDKSSLEEAVTYLREALVVRRSLDNGLDTAHAALILASALFHLSGQQAGTPEMLEAETLLVECRQLTSRPDAAALRAWCDDLSGRIEAALPAPHVVQ